MSVQGLPTIGLDSDSLAAANFDQLLRDNERIVWAEKATGLGILTSDFGLLHKIILIAGVFAPFYLTSANSIVRVMCLSCLLLLRFIFLKYVLRNYIFWISTERFGYRFLGRSDSEKRWFKKSFRQTQDSGWVAYSLGELRTVEFRSGWFRKGEVYFNSVPFDMARVTGIAMTDNLYSADDLTRQVAFNEIRFRRFNSIGTGICWWGVMDPGKVAALLMKTREAARIEALGKQS